MDMEKDSHFQTKFLEEDELEESQNAAVFVRLCPDA